ncbi:sensor histidine kinase [Pararhodonellum marinum]|uniref:sensor histidine kinase n=1 Tax=Pararhodonellum marinum TaxID=2755358 RepID=UPI0018907F7A|nr:sensor histidine kinase [Pararhodonellum marinum]
MQKLTSKTNFNTIIHVLVWVLMGMVLFIISPLSWKVELPSEFWVRQGIIFSLLIAIFYFNINFLVPKYLFTGKIWTFLFIVILTSIGLLWGVQRFEIMVNMQKLMHYAFRPEIEYVPKPRNIAADIFTLMVFFLSYGVSTSVATVQKWRQDEKTREELDQARISSELSYLKAQINPHFFFNTLNNIYSLTNIDVDKAQKALLKLSRMMRYVLYETENEKTLLKKELDFVKDYIELMKLRLSDKVDVKLDLQEHIPDQVVAPMLLLPFIENCFKHGISSQTASKVYIGISVNQQQLKLQTVNYLFPNNKNTPESQSSGIGLTNTKRRLSILYPGKHQINVDDNNEANEYRVELTLNLS